MFARDHFGQRQTIDVVTACRLVRNGLRVYSGIGVLLTDDLYAFVVFHNPFIQLAAFDYGSFIVVYHGRQAVDEDVINRVAGLLVVEVRIAGECLAADHYLFAGANRVALLFLNLLQYRQIQDITGRVAVRTHLNPGVSAAYAVAHAIPGIYGIRTDGYCPSQRVFFVTGYIQYRGGVATMDIDRVELIGNFFIRSDRIAMPCKYRVCRHFPVENLYVFVCDVKRQDNYRVASVALEGLFIYAADSIGLAAERIEIAATDSCVDICFGDLINGQV